MNQSFTIDYHYIPTLRPHIRANQGCTWCRMVYRLRLRCASQCAYQHRSDTSGVCSRRRPVQHFAPRQRVADRLRSRSTPMGYGPRRLWRSHEAANEMGNESAQSTLEDPLTEPTDYRYNRGFQSCFCNFNESLHKSFRSYYFFESTPLLHSSCFVFIRNRNTVLAALGLSDSVLVVFG